MSMAHSLELRSPFLDHRLVEFVARLPDRHKVRMMSRKYILRKAFADMLPPSILRLPKRGFEIPVSTWLRGPLYETARELLLDDGLARRGYFRPEAIARLLAEHRNGQFDHGRRLWALMIFEMWHRTFAD